MAMLSKVSRAKPDSTLQKRQSAPILVLAALATLSFVLLPVLYLVQRALQGEWATTKIIIFRSKTLEVLITTVSLVLLVAAIAAVIGISLAWSLYNVKLAAPNLLRALVVLPMAIPSYVFTYCWLSLGVLPEGFIGAVAVLTLSTTPYVTLAAMAALHRIDSSQIDVAQTLGLNQFQTLRRVTLPQMRNAIASGVLLVSLYVLSDFGAVSLLGVDTFTRAIHNTYQGSFDRSTAAILSLMLVAVSAVVISMEVTTRKRLRIVKSSVAIARQRQRLDSVKSQTIATTIFGVYILTSLAIPISVLGYRFISRSEPIEATRLLQASVSTILVSSIGALLALLLALPIAILSIRSSLLGRLAERGVLVVSALPGIVIGLSLVAFGSDIPWAYQTLGLLAFAYSILFVARSVGTIRNALARVPESLPEIAATLGQTRSRIFYRVTLPLAAPGVIAGTLLVLLSAMKELPATLMLRPTGFETLATEIWNNTAIFRFSEAAPYALLLVAIAAVPTFLLGRPDKDAERGEHR